MIIFYLLSIIFIWSNTYYLLNYNRLDKRFSQRERNSKIDLIYYITKVLFWIWIITGLIIDYNYILLLIVSPSILKFPMFYINKKVYSLLYRLTPPFHIIVLIITLYIKLL
jgi:hypothetical protein